MRKKIFTFLLALVTSVGLSWAVPTEFANCYDCWRSPEYPNISGQCHLFNFGNPGVGNGNPSGPWKLEFVEYYNSSSTEYDDIVSSYAASQYGKSPEQMEVYRLYQWQNGAYQPVAYGVLYAYANESNPVEHAAFFEANGYWGCYFTDNTHSSGDDFNITFNEDASTGFADLHGGSTPAVDPTPTPSGDGDKLAGAFSVSGTKVVYFSKGNLRATTNDLGATWTWGFAENQWDYVGNSAANNAINGGGTVSTNGPVDLFAWSSTANNYFGINNSINEADYSGDFKDWGAKMGSNWHTLTINEWQYLLQERNPGSSSANHTSYPRYTNAQILTDGTAPQKDIKGIILFPDDFNDGGESIDGVTWGSINPSFFSSYTTYCTTAGWATLESMGCVFLPSAGSRQKFGDEFAIVDVAIMGNYWSSTLYSGEPEDPQSIVVGDGTLGIGTNPRYFGLSVRLVSETAPSPSPAPVGLQVTELEIPDSWQNDQTLVTISDLPGFVAVSLEEAGAWDAAPAGDVVLIYTGKNDEGVTAIEFNNRVLNDFGPFGGFSRADIFDWASYGYKIFYTSGGSTPTPANSCGANVTWEFDPSTGALTITGTGAMDDYLNNASTPWNSYIDDITSVTITDGVTNVGNHSFEQCTSLTTVTIGDDVETIGTFAFSECGEQFTTLTLGNSIRTIGNQAFASDRGITGFTLPNTLETIGDFAFIHNKAITTLTIPSNVTSIGADAFYGCTAVTDVYCYPNAAALTWNDADCDDFKSGKATICHVNSDQLDAYQTKFNDVVRVTFVGDLDAPAPTPNPSGECGAQGDNLLWELNTSTGVLTITGSGAMYDWPYDTDLPWYDNRLQITSVVLPSGITSIGTKAFRGCTNLASINMTENYPAGLTAINQEAFCHTALTSVTIPESVVTIGQDAFYQSQSITDVYCYADPNNLTWTDFWCDDFTSAKSTQCHVKDCYLDVYNSKWNTNSSSTDVNVTFVGDLPGDCGGSTPAPTSFTFPAGTTIYYDFTAYGNGINVYAPGAPTDWYENTANIIPVTLSSDWEISASTNLFKSDASGWNFVTGTILPTDGQNMIVSTNGVDYAWGTHVPAYTVAGEPAVAFGTPTWAPTNTDNDMVKQSNGTYKWEKEDVELAKDAVVSFKVCQDHGWDVAYPNDNFNHTILADGIYTLTITFDPNAEGDKVAINALKTADVVVAQTAEMKGFGDWNTGIALENINEGAAARVSKNLTAGTHEFKMIINDGWRGKVGATITRANNTVAEIVDNPNESNITLTADIPGDYTFTWTYETNTLSIEFPSLVVYVQNLIAAIGEVNLESGDAINAARTAYDNLLDADQKQAVSNYGVLEAAEAAYAALAQAAADQLAANTVKGLIDAIDNPVVYTNDCKAKIDAARAAYDALTDAQKTLVGDEYAQKLADAEAAYDAFIVYTVAGEPEALFGSFWNIGDTNNDMVKQSNGTYKWEKSEVALAAGIAKFKIIKDHVTYEYPTSNYELQIEEDGIYTVTIIYNPKAAEDRITTNALKTGEAVIVHTAEMKGSWNNWTDGLELENINEGAAARATKILTPGTYEFKMIIDGSWLGEASTMFTRNENAKAEIGGDEDNLKLNADIPGCYTFTWTYETNTLEIGYPNYIDADFAIDFRTDPYTKVGGGDLPAGVLVEGSMNTGDAQHGYRLPVITIPVTAGNYKVMMGTCTYSNQDATIKTEDNSYTYATLATNNGTCYHQNTATNVVGAIFNVPSDQIIKVYGAEYTPFFSIKKMEAVPAFTDFEISFQSNPYEVISGAKPEGTVIAGSHNDADHGYHNVEATVPMQAGNYRLTLGACGYGNGAGSVISETNVELASFNQKLEDNNKCYHQDPANNIVSMIFTVDIDQTITIDCGEYTPYMKLEKLQDNTYYINFENAEGAIGTVPGEVAIAAGESWTIPANLTLYKEGYTFVGWSDGVNTYAPGDEFFPSAHGTLQAVYTANSVSIADASAINVKWYFGESNGAPSVTWNGVAGYLLAKGEVDGELIDLKLDIDATSGKFHNAGRGDKWAQVNANTVFTFPSKEGAVVNVETYSGNETYDLAAGTLTCNVNDYYSYLEIVYPAPTTAVVIGDPNDADQVNAFLNTYDGQTIDELVIDRPVYNNMYNTLCLPFDMDATQIAASSLNGVIIREFTGASVVGQTLELAVSDPVNAVVAGRPYFVQYSAASQLDDLHFEGVTINKAVLDDEAITFNGVTFKGTFTPFVMPNGLNFQGGYLFLGQNNQLFWPNTPNPLKPFRAYFYVNVEASTPGNAPKYRGMPARIVEGKNVATGVENAQSANQSTKVIVNGQLIIIKNDVRYNAQGQIVK